MLQIANSKHEPSWWHCRCGKYYCKLCHLHCPKCGCKLNMKDLSYWMQQAKAELRKSQENE